MEEICKFLLEPGHCGHLSFIPPIRFAAVLKLEEIQSFVGMAILTVNKEQRVLPIFFLSLKY